MNTNDPSLDIVAATHEQTGRARTWIEDRIAKPHTPLNRQNSAGPPVRQNEAGHLPLESSRRRGPPVHQKQGETPPLVSSRRRGPPVRQNKARHLPLVSSKRRGLPRCGVVFRPRHFADIPVGSRPPVSSSFAVPICRPRR